MVKNDAKNEIIELGAQVRKGDRDFLASWARPRLFEYVYRHTQDYDIAEDIVQETMIQMFKALGKLEKEEQFWPWLRKIAFHKIGEDYKQHKHTKTASISQTNEQQLPQSGGKYDKQTGLANLIGQELREIIFAAMRQIKPAHRELLIMRCYDNMEYDQIARELSCSEFSVRMRFWRAKQSLQKQLSRRGLGKGALLTALVMLGMMTARSEAAAGQISLSAATIKVGTPVALAGLAGTKMALLSLAAAGAITAGYTITSREPKPQDWAMNHDDFLTN
jgi:RNA polymerase sigma-70 factor (ECF subfamily)